MDDMIEVFNVEFGKYLKGHNAVIIHLPISHIYSFPEMFALIESKRVSLYNTVKPIQFAADSQPSWPSSIGEQGGWLRGGYPLLKKIYDPPPLKLKMTPTPSEMAFDPIPRF